MNEFDPKIGFRPTGNALKFWTLLPQVSSNSNNPPLFGKIKGITLYYIMVGILILLEAVLAYSLNEEGLNFITFLVLSIADFALVIFPSFFHLSPSLNSAIINANIFINEKKLRIDNKKPETIDTHDSYVVELRKELNKWKSNRTKNRLLSIAVFIAVVGLAIWKFFSFYSVLGDDIFVEAIGRFILTSLIISILVHVICTKVVCYHLFYSATLRKQRKEFEEFHEHKIQQHETNKPFALMFNVPYTPVVANNQRICEEVSSMEINNLKIQEEKVTLIQLNNSGVDRDYRIDRIENKDNAKLIYTGLLLDAEVTSLSIGQADTDARTAVIVSGKEIQLSQIITQ